MLYMLIFIHKHDTFHCTYITYIIGHYNPSLRIVDLVSNTIYVVCVNFIHKWRNLQFKVDSERQIFWETFHSNFIYSQEFLPEIRWEEIAEEILLVFCFDVRPGTFHCNFVSFSSFCQKFVKKRPWKELFCSYFVIFRDVWDVPRVNQVFTSNKTTVSRTTATLDFLPKIFGEKVAREIFVRISFCWRCMAYV